MANTIDIYTPRTLAAVVRTAPPTQAFFRDTIFTNRKTFITERVDIDIVKGDRRMAAFVHPRVGGKVLERTGYETQSYAAPLINPYDITTADQFIKRLPGENIYSGMTPAQRAAQILTEEYTKLDDAITRREEWMCAQALINGQIPVVGEGVNDVIDYGFSNKVTLAEGVQWGDDGVSIIDNLREWVDTVYTYGFSNITRAIVGKEVIKKIIADSEIQNLLDNRRYLLGQISPANLPNGVRYYGNLAEPGIDIYTYNEVYLDDWTDPENPSVNPLVPDNVVILLPENPNFSLYYGACTYLDDAGQWQTAETSRLLRSYIKHSPDRRMLEVQARPLPITDKIDSWFVAEVC